MARTKPKNRRSDTQAKLAFAKVLSEEGYEYIRCTSAPADVTARLGGVTHYFELKCTEQKKRYFGAATLTGKWKAAQRWPKRYWFVVATQQANKWCFEKYTPKEFMTFSYVPPFKIFFNLEIGRRDEQPRRRPRAIMLTSARMRQLVNFYEGLRED